MKIPRLAREVLLTLLLSGQSAFLALAAQTSRDISPQAVEEAIADPANLLLMDVTVDRISVAGAMTAYQVGPAVYVPMGEMARVLTLLVQVDTATKLAKGFLLKTEQTFTLDAAAGRVILADEEKSFDPVRVSVQSDDIYVDTALLEEWWPIRIKPDLSTLKLIVKPLQPLPLQLRLQRERAARNLNTARPTGRSFASQAIPYAFLSFPTIDQTISLFGGRSPGSDSWAMSSSTFLSGDLMGLEATGFAYAGATNGPKSDSKFRLTLGRSDASGVLFGKLPATTAQFGNIVLPGIEHISRSSSTGNGLLLSNASLSRPLTYGVTSFQGPLQPGWDVELYFNDALVGYQKSRADGTYAFEDQTLIFGENRYRLVFHGPQGQVRIETKTLQLDASTVRPREFFYTLGTQQDEQGFERQLLELEYGLSSEIALHGGLQVTTATRNRLRRHYATSGVRSFNNGWMLNAEGVWCAECNGGLLSFGLNRRLGSGALQASHKVLRDFVSDLFPQTERVIDAATDARVDFSIPVTAKRSLPLTARFRADHLKSGKVDHLAAVRVTQSYLGTAITNEVTHQRADGSTTIGGNLQLSRTIAGASTRAQLAHMLYPKTKAQVGSIVTDMSLPAGFRLNTSLTRIFDTRDTTLALNLDRSFGSFSIRSGLTRNSTGTVSLSMQLFTSIARDVRARQWRLGVRPTGSTGSVSARTFLDRNLNGLFDEPDEAIEGANFRINGSTSPARSDADGFAYIDRLPPHRPVTIELNSGSLSDAQWSPTTEGVSLISRPGRMAGIDFPVIVTAEVDGYVYLEKDGQQKGVSDVVIDLYDARGAVVASVRSTADGYYLFSGVRPGRYTIGVSPELLDRLRLEPVEAEAVEISADDTFVDPIDFVLRFAEQGDAREGGSQDSQNPPPIVAPSR